MSNTTATDQQHGTGNPLKQIHLRYVLDSINKKEYLKVVNLMTDWNQCWVPVRDWMNGETSGWRESQWDQTRNKRVAKFKGFFFPWFYCKNWKMLCLETDFWFLYYSSATMLLISSGVTLIFWRQYEEQNWILQLHWKTFCFSNAPVRVMAFHVAVTNVFSPGTHQVVLQTYNSSQMSCAEN